jgi:hypothetical protein
MGSTTGIVTWKYGGELGGSVFVGSLYASQIYLVEIRVIVIMVVAKVLNAGVASSGVAVPNFPVDIFNWLACVHIDEFPVQDQWNPRLSISNIGSDQIIRIPSHRALQASRIECSAEKRIPPLTPFVCPEGLSLISTFQFQQDHRGNRVVNH